MLIVQRFHVSWSPPVQRGRLRGDLGDEMQPDLRRDSLPRQPGWLYSPPGVVFWKPLKNFQSLNGFHKESHFPGREGGFGKMPKSSDWRNRPFANFRPRQTKVSPCLTLDWWSLHMLYHSTWIRFILASKTKVAFHHLIWFWFVLASCQLEQTSGSLLRHPGEQGDELHWGEQTLVNEEQFPKN